MFVTAEFDQGSGQQFIGLPAFILDVDGDPITESVDLQTAAAFGYYDSPTRQVILLLDENVCPGAYMFTATLDDAFAQTEYPFIIVVNNDESQNCI